MKKLPKVYGHPRSGNNFLMALLGENLYPNMDLSSPAGHVGHWSDRVKVGRPKYGKLAGHHGLPREGYYPGRSVYIYRDGRAVVTSLWKSPHFKNKAWEGMTLAEFIRRPMDWLCTPARKANPSMNPIQHWDWHLRLWGAAKMVLSVRYEDLVNDRELAVNEIARELGLESHRRYAGANVDWPVGWSPTGGFIDGWRKHWTNADEDYFFSIVARDFWGVYNG